MNYKLQLLVYCSFFLILTISSLCYGACGSYQEAMNLKEASYLEVDKEIKNNTVKEIKLPVSRGFNQKRTALCWVYSALNMIETNYLYAHQGAQIELSRRFLQYYTMEDRFLRHIIGESTLISERGVSVDAISLIRLNGIVVFDDFLDVSDPYGDYYIKRNVDAQIYFEDKINTLYFGLKKKYGLPPRETTFNSEDFSAIELANLLIGNYVFESYGISKDGFEGYGDHPDPDARNGTKSYFIGADKVHELIKNSLENGNAVEYSTRVHSLMIYGSNYDSEANPLVYFVKDSYPDYFYTISPEYIINHALELTTVKIF